MTYTMTSLAGSTKKDLLAIAKTLNISGRHDMNTETLVKAIVADNSDLGTEPTGEFITAEQLVDIKRRKPSKNRRDASGRVIRSGTNLSGNLPFRHKYYALKSEFADLSKTPQTYQDAVAKAPMQVQLLLKAMRELGYVEGGSCGTGGIIAGEAKAKRFIKSKIEPANLFAYYRRVLEALGVVETEPSDEDDGEA